jgi:hypothetical protein
MIRLVKRICGTEQQDMIKTAESILGALLNGAVALRHMRMYPQFLGEAVERVLSTKPKPSVKPKRQQKQ